MKKLIFKKQLKLMKIHEKQIPTDFEQKWIMQIGEDTNL